MMVRTAVAAAGLVVLLGAVAGCGGSSSSTSSAGGANDATASPRDADKDDFCRTFTELGGDVTPNEAATRLMKVGTPSDISGSARDGFVLLTTQLFTLPDDSKGDDLRSLAENLRGGDQSDVIAFVTYYASECSDVPSM